MVLLRKNLPLLTFHIFLIYEKILSCFIPGELQKMVFHYLSVQKYLLSEVCGMICVLLVTAKYINNNKNENIFSPHDIRILWGGFDRKCG